MDSSVLEEGRQTQETSAKAMQKPQGIPKPAQEEKHVNFADEESSDNSKESEEEEETSSGYSERESMSESSSTPSQKLRRSKSYTAESKKERNGAKRCRSVASPSSSEEQSEDLQKTVQRLKESDAKIKEE